MPVCIYYLDISLLSTYEMQRSLPLFPDFIVRSILKYRNSEDQLLVFAGKLLLLFALEQLEYSDKPDLSDMKYTTYKRPYFEYPIEFSIAHSGSYALLAFTTSCKIGIDIEKIHPIDLTDFSGVFTQKEWNALNQQADWLQPFFQLWTKKEAVAKAIGKGLYIPLSQIDVCNPTVEADGEIFWLHQVDIDNRYIINLAMSSQSEEIRVCKPNLRSYIHL